MHCGVRKSKMRFCFGEHFMCTLWARVLNCGRGFSCETWKILQLRTVVEAFFHWKPTENNSRRWLFGLAKLSPQIWGCLIKTVGAQHMMMKLWVHLAETVNVRIREADGAIKNLQFWKTFKIFTVSSNTNYIKHSANNSMTLQPVSRCKSVQSNQFSLENFVVAIGSCFIQATVSWPKTCSSTHSRKSSSATKNNKLFIASSVERHNSVLWLLLSIEATQPSVHDGCWKSKCKASHSIVPSLIFSNYSPIHTSIKYDPSNYVAWIKQDSVRRVSVKATEKLKFILCCTKTRATISESVPHVLHSSGILVKSEKRTLHSVSVWQSAESRSVHSSCLF